MSSSDDAKHTQYLILRETLSWHDLSGEESVDREDKGAADLGIIHRVG